VDLYESSPPILPHIGRAHDEVFIVQPYARLPKEERLGEDFVLSQTLTLARTEY
jgi:hypothetical protein